MTVRTRFAPSPTGYLHLGGARTALFSWLYARHHQGEFVLRIEDTDLERSTEESKQAILDGMAWLGLNYDHGPYYQTDRFDRYKQVIEQLLESGHAYRCYCSKERLSDLREKQIKAKQKPRYDGHCRDKNLPHRDEPYVIRFRTPLDGSVEFEDQVYGMIRIANSELDDLIIQRSDGSPTYNFTVVVDDWDMQITHIVRGDDHINNTPRQINILQALGAEIPVYAHVPMILGPDGKRLSKRHGAVSVLQYREDGYLPEAMLNGLVRLGWSFGDEELFTIDQMIEMFDLKGVSKGAASFNIEKLQWLNQHYMKASVPSELADTFAGYLQDAGVSEAELSAGPELANVVEVQAERAKTLVEMVEKSLFFYQEFDEYDEKAAKKHLVKDNLPALEMLKNRLAGLPQWEEEPMHQIVIETAAHFDLKLGKVAQPLRVAVTGGTVSPPIDTTLFLIGKERVVARLERVLEFIDKF